MKSGIITIGLTGSIGMGKSVTAKIFIQANIPVFDSDAAVHMLMAENGRAVDRIEKSFPGVARPDGIDRILLGKKVFGDKKALKKLEAILHPMVSQMRQAFIAKARTQGLDMVVLDVPLLFETGGDKYCDYTLVVSSPEPIQRQRVLARPDMTEQKFNDITERQMADQEKRQRADFIIQNDRGIDYVEKQVGKIITKIRKTANA